jgi:hypothetical protein
MQPWGGFRRPILQSQRLAHFQRHIRNLDHFLLHLLFSIQAVQSPISKGRPTSTPAVLPLESHSKISTLSALNGPEGSVQPGATPEGHSWQSLTGRVTCLFPGAYFYLRRASLTGVHLLQAGISYRHAFS